MIKISTSIFTIAIFLSGCFSTEEVRETKNEILGKRTINYYSEKSVSPLDIPPNLTQPDYQNAFRLSEYVNDIKEDVVSFSDKKNNAPGKDLRKSYSDIEVKRSGQRRWLLVNKKSEVVWDLSKAFLKEQGFVIKKNNTKTGILETNYLENRPIAPDASVGLIRSLIRKATGQSYSLPTADKYRLRVEPIGDDKTEVYLTLFSIEEVVKNTSLKEGNTVWQNKERDTELETEMLYQLMVYLGADSAKSRENIIEAKEIKKTVAHVEDGLNGYAKLVFDTNFLEAWDNFSWALDQAEIELDDKDLKEKSFYIKSVRTADEGILTRVFGGDAVIKTFQITLKEVTKNKTEIYFNDLSEVNEIETKEYSYDFFRKIATFFK